jgi:hypothetical protein
MHARAILGSALVMVWLAFQTTMVMAHVAATPHPASTEDYTVPTDMHGGSADASHDHGGPAHSGGCDHQGHGSVSLGCCSITCVAFIVIESDLVLDGAPAVSYQEAPMRRLHAFTSLLATPPPDRHL